MVKKRNMEKVKVNKQFSLKVKDFIKGIYLAVIVPALVTVLEVVQAGSFDLDLKSIGLISVSALAAYLLKNFFTPTEVVVTEPKANTVKMASGKDPKLHPKDNPIHPKK